MMRRAGLATVSGARLGTMGGAGPGSRRASARMRARVR